MLEGHFLSYFFFLENSNDQSGLTDFYFNKRTFLFKIAINTFLRLAFLCLKRDNQNVLNVVRIIGQIMLLKRKSIEKEESLRPPADGIKKNKTRKIRYAPVTLSEQGGVRFLHFGTEWIQGAMRLKKPHWLELEYSRKMMAWLLFNLTPRSIVQLGLGAGSLTKFCYFQIPESIVTAVELNPDVIAVSHSMFMVPDSDERLHILEMDALKFVQDEGNFNHFDVLHVDLYDATAKGPVLDTPEFYAACKQCLVFNGMMTVNLFGDHPSYEKNIEAMRKSFPEVVCLSPSKEGNVVVLAFKKKPVFNIEELTARAVQIKEKYALDAKKWLRDLKNNLI